MILTKEVYVTICSANYNYFKQLGYANLKYRSRIKIPIKHLTKGSKEKVLVKCDVCGCEKYINYLDYNKNFKKHNTYSCSQKCGNEKRKATTMLKYGVNSVAKTQYVKEQRERTNIKKYGFKCSLQNKDIKQKAIETLQKNYGVNVPSKNKSIVNKMKDTNMKKYGVPCTTQVKEIFDKQKRSAFKTKIHKETGLHYQGTYEKDFLDFCFKNNIQVYKGKSIQYSYKNELKTYHSDFYVEIKNLIVEIKSMYTFKKEFGKNLEKRKASLKKGYKFIFIINKNYKEFLKIIVDKDDCQ